MPVRLRDSDDAPPVHDMLDWVVGGFALALPIITVLLIFRSR